MALGRLWVDWELLTGRKHGGPVVLGEDIDPDPNPNRPPKTLRFPSWTVDDCANSPYWTVKNCNCLSQEQKAVLSIYPLIKKVTEPVYDPPKPETLVGALQDNVHKEVGKSRTPKVIRATGKKERAISPEVVAEALGAKLAGKAPKGAKWTPNMDIVMAQESRARDIPPEVWKCDKCRNTFNITRDALVRDTRCPKASCDGRLENTGEVGRINSRCMMENGVVEVALVFDHDGCTLAWHDPSGRTGISIPDTKSHWDILWEHRERLGGVAHTHPWNGDAWYSQEDVTTWSANERALGRRLLWPVVTFTDVQVFEWVGPGKFDYKPVRCPEFRVVDIDELRQRSKVPVVGTPTGKE